MLSGLVCAGTVLVYWSAASGWEIYSASSDFYASLFLKNAMLKSSRSGHTDAVEEPEKKLRLYPDQAGIDDKGAEA